MILFLAVLMLTGRVDAAVQTTASTYHHGDTVLEGYLAYEDATAGHRPTGMAYHAEADRQS